MSLVAWHAIRRRRRTGLIWWSIGLAGMAALLAVAYPTVRDNSELDRTFANLPPGVEQLLGLGGGNPLTSPTGYLNSQFFANILPVMLLVYAVGAAAWTIAGDESAGTLELLLANPIGRVRVALARFGALIVTLAGLAAVSLLILVALTGPTGLDNGLTTARLVAATAASALLALVLAALAFAVGAATGSRPAALAVASGVAVAGYLVEGLAPQVAALRPARFVNPWHWLLATDPLRNGLTWQTWVPPLVAAAALVVASLPVLARRDLG
jgi:ABC-2 type transport system permease protein